MDGLDVSHAAAALAGLLSFASPCVLPLVPAYLAFLGGVGLDRLDTDASASRRRMVGAAFAFVLGFSTVFVAMGASASAVNRLLFEHMGWLSVAAGLVIVTLGLHYMGVFRIGFLLFERRFHVERQPAGLAGACLVGFAFAFGWTPCVGPVLAVVLMVAAGQDSVWYGTSLLGAYALGMGLPFILAALLADPFLRMLRRIRLHVRTIEIATGALLVVTGVLILTGRITDVGFWLLDAVPALGRIG